MPYSDEIQEALDSIPMNSKSESVSTVFESARVLSFISQDPPELMKGMQIALANPEWAMSMLRLIMSEDELNGMLALSLKITKLFKIESTS